MAKLQQREINRRGKLGAVSYSKDLKNDPNTNIWQCGKTLCDCPICGDPCGEVLALQSQSDKSL